jgi:GNAT superfamily N-acetyltransferase
MTAMTLATADSYAINVDNLTGLWQHFGSTAVPLPDSTTMHISTAWPHRVWFNPHAQPQQLSQWKLAIEVAPPGSTFVVWDMARPAQPCWHRHLHSLGLAPGTALTGMIMPAADIAPGNEMSLSLTTVTDSRQARLWAKLCGRSFGYRVDERVIAGILDIPDIWIMSGLLRGQLVATTLLYRTGDVVGVHQVGVDPEHRGLGIARAMMQSALSAANEKWRPSRFVLQASEQGRGLYRQLGFRQQFTLGLFSLNQIQ